MEKNSLEKNDGRYYAADKKVYYAPQLTNYGTLISLTQTNRGGPQRDGGTNPYHKGPPTTGGAFNIDVKDYNSRERGGRSDGGDIFEG